MTSGAGSATGGTTVPSRRAFAAFVRIVLQALHQVYLPSLRLESRKNSVSGLACPQSQQAFSGVLVVMVVLLGG